MDRHKWQAWETRLRLAPASGSSGALAVGEISMITRVSREVGKANDGCFIVIFGGAAGSLLMCR